MTTQVCIQHYNEPVDNVWYLAIATISELYRNIVFSSCQDVIHNCLLRSADLHSMKSSDSTESAASLLYCISHVVSGLFYFKEVSILDNLKGRSGANSDSL